MCPAICVLYITRRNTDAPPESNASAYPSGWIMGVNFLKYIERFVKGIEKAGIALLNCQIFSDSDFISPYIFDRPQENTNGNLDVDNLNADDTVKNKDNTNETIITTFSQSSPWALLILLLLHKKSNRMLQLLPKSKFEKTKKKL